MVPPVRVVVLPWNSAEVLPGFLASLRLEEPA